MSSEEQFSCSVQLGDRRDFCEKPICGDLPLRLSLSLDGYGYYFNRIMSAYRTGNPNSASGQAAKNKQAIRNTFYGHKAILDGFNEYTEYRWNEEIQFDINRRKFRTYFSTEDYAAIRQEGLNSFIRKNGTRAFLIKYFLRTKTPGLFKLLKRVKTLVKK